MAALWKQEKSLHPTFDRLNRCLEADWFLLPFELRLQRAHAAALAAAGIVSEAERASIDRALREISSSQSVDSCPASDVEDLHTWIEQELVKRCGEAGKKIHTARSRNDQVATLLKMFLVSAGAQAQEGLTRLVKSAARRAVEWCEVPMPLMTHQQFAAPGTAGYWALRFAIAFDRVRRNLSGATTVWRLCCPLGSGAVAGSSIDIDRSIQASELGFEGPSACALDATSTRDECLEFLFFAAQAGLHLQSFATDVIVFSQTPLAWTKYPEEFGTGSSMMPNKMNPDAMELLRGEACSLIAAQGQAMLLLKGLPSGYNRDLQCIKPIVREAAGQLGRLLELATAFVERLEWNVDRLAASMGQGAIEATLRMERYVKAGRPLREAHHAVAEAVKAGEPLLDGSPDAWVRTYSTLGSANPAETRRVAEELLASLGPSKQRSDPTAGPPAKSAS